MLDTRLTQVFSHPSLMAMANRGLPANQMPILKDNHCWLPHLQRGGPMGPGSAVFPIQPLRPLAFMATGSHPHIPQTISPRRLIPSNASTKPLLKRQRSASRKPPRRVPQLPRKKPPRRQRPRKRPLQRKPHPRLRRKRLPRKLPRRLPQNLTRMMPPPPAVILMLPSARRSARHLRMWLRSAAMRRPSQEQAGGTAASRYSAALLPTCLRYEGSQSLILRLASFISAVLPA